MAFDARDKEFNSVDFIMAFEDGLLDYPTAIDGFQHLIDSGLVWRLQSCYGRAAVHFIKSGACVDTHNRLGLQVSA